VNDIFVTTSSQSVSMAWKQCLVFHIGKSTHRAGIEDYTRLIDRLRTTQDKTQKENNDPKATDVATCKGIKKVLLNFDIV
jgi:hypothetical protein